MNRLMSAADVSQHLAFLVSEARVMKAYHLGALTATKIGRTVLFAEADVEQWLDSCRTSAPSGISTRRAPKSPTTSRKA